VLLKAIESDGPFAADAAAEALADSGALAAARLRSETGQATDSDRVLLEYVEAQEAVRA
jgi:hypothetical protein